MKRSKGKVFRRFLSLIMALTICMGSMVTAFAQTEDSTEKDSGNPIIVSVEKASGSLDLTQLGTLDWMHITSESINRKKDGENLISFKNLSGNPLSTLKDGPVQYSWTDGSEQETVTNSPKGGVFNYKAGEDSSVNTDIKEDAGYRLTIPAADYARQLVFVSGIWQAQAKIAISVNDSDSPIYQTDLQAADPANVQKYTVVVRAGYSVDVTCKIKKKTNVWGNLSLGGIALSKLTPPDPVTVQVTNAPNAMNLTEKGDVDWIHPVGVKDTTDKKNVAESVIQIKNRNEAYSTGTMTDSPVYYSWSDGAPMQAASNNRKGAIYNYKNGDKASVNVNITEASGYEITIPTADYARQLTFVSGIWRAVAGISIYLNDSSAPVYENSELASESGGAIVKMYVVNANPGDSVKVVCQLKKKTHTSGNISLTAVTLGKLLDDDNDYKIKSEALLQKAKDLDTTECSDFLKKQIEHEIANCEEVLKDSASTSDDYYAAYFFLKQAYDPAYAACMDGNGEYIYQSNSRLVSSFGWEGDINAPIAYLDGSYQLRSYGNSMITFGVTDIPGKIKWYNAEGYLPCFISEYSKKDMDYKIENFADLVEVNGNKFEIAYSRMTITNKSGVRKNLPIVSNQLVPLNESAKTATKINAGQTVVREYAIPADRFGESYVWPSNEALATLGGFDEHYTHMKKYWNDRLEPLAVIKNLPDKRLIDAYKAGFIYTLIIRDDVKKSDGTMVKELHVGENGYDKMFDHDTIGIVATLLTMGDYTFAKEYLASLPAQLQYDDAKWKYSWPYALYLRKTGDADFIGEHFEAIKTNTHKIETDRIDDGKGIIKKTNAIDSNGYWTTDDWSALAGLTSYRYICNKLGQTAEEEWAKAEYEDLLQVVTNKLQETMTKYNLDYIPISMVEPNETCARKDPRDANWASMFLFGRWGWDGYLFGAEQSGIMLDKIDDTYTHGFERREDLTDNPYNFGGYPHGYFCSAYNAGYGSTALRAEEYRDAGIKGYQFMIDEAMSGPFGWWEGVGYPSDESPWDIDHASTGGGSCQHMWGQSTATKVLFDSLIAEKVDDTVIIGRGIPVEWLTNGQNIEIANYPVKNNNRIGYKLTTTGATVTLEFTGDVSKVPFSLELMGLKNNIKSAGGLSFNQEKGTVTVPAGTQKVTVQMKKPCVDNTALESAVRKLNKVIKGAQVYSADPYTHESFLAFKSAMDKATTLLASENKTVEQVEAVTEAINQAVKSLEPIEIANFIDFTNGNMNSSYAFGKTNDQYKRYQTFFALQTGKASKVEVKVGTQSENKENLTDLTVELYALKDDNKSLDQLITSTTVKKENVKIGGQSTVIPMDFELTEGKGYALVLGQVTADNTNFYNWQVMSNDNNKISYMKWNKETDGSDKFVDESHLGKGWMKITIFKYSKETLQSLIENAKKLNARYYTADSWANFSATLNSANEVLQKSRDSEAVKAAETNVSNAISALVKRPANSGKHSSDTAAVKPPVTSTVPATSFKLDTTSTCTLGVGGKYYFLVKTDSNMVPVVTSNSESVMAVFSKKVDGGYLFEIKGESNGMAIITAQIGNEVASFPVVVKVGSVKSDTTLPFSIKAGDEYCFKMSVMDANSAMPNFMVGNGSAFKTKFLKRIGNDYYFKIETLGKSGMSTGIYTSMPGQVPVRQCIVSIA